MNEHNDPVDDMRQFWENSFNQYETMWGFEPTRSAILANEYFLKQGVTDILIPGIGYGRNARVFTQNGIHVTGIEISASAIALAKKHYGTDLHIYHGSVTDMPFDDHLYEGIFCYGLLYLLNDEQRKKMIQDCYQQLTPGGWMIFSVVSVNSPNYGKGKEVAPHTFEIGKGGVIYFYNTEAMREQFGQYGLEEIIEIDEQTAPDTGKPAFRFYMAICRKPH